jgi:hypothetical protein
MAKVIMADGSEIRGKIGGKVYSRNASGAFVRKFVKPTNKNSALQQTSRNAFASVSNAYRTLTDAQRQTFETMRTFYKRPDALGNLVTPTASQLFSRLNGVLLQNGQVSTGTLMTTCPSPFPLVGVKNLAPTFDISDGELLANITFNDNTVLVPTGQKVIVMATPSISAGIKSVPKGIFSKIALLDEDDNTGTLPIETGYFALFGTPQAGDTFYMKVQSFSVSTGEVTSETIAVVSVVA